MMVQPRILRAALDLVPAQGEILDNYKGRSGKFIKGFLLNTKRNKNGWRVTWDSILTYSSDFINHPGIYMTKFGEPDHTDGISYKDNMVAQEEFRVVNIIDVLPCADTQTLNYVGEIIDAEFEELWNAGKINMTSPAVWPEEMEQVGTMIDGRPELDVFQWRALHVAYINDPAYGNDANTITTCDGDGIACRVRLSAKTEGCGLCANDNLGPLMEVPLIKRVLNSTYSQTEITQFYAQLITATDDSCVSNKLKIIKQDNPGMEKDQQLAIAYSYCKKDGIAELRKNSY